MSSKTRASSPGGVTLYERHIWDLFGFSNWLAMNTTHDDMYLSPIIIPYRLTIDRLGCVINAAAGNIRLGIYADNGDTPAGGALLAESAATLAVVRKNELALTIGTLRLNPGLHWLAINQDNDAMNPDGQVIDDMNQGGTLRSKFAVHVFGPLPNPCPAVADSLHIVKYVRVLSVP